MSKSERALVPASKKVPSLRISKDLESADARTVVHVDRSGQVRSPMRYRVITALSWAGMFGCLAGVTVIYAIRFGAPGVTAGLAMAAWIILRTRPALALRRAVRLITAEELDDAEAIVRGVVANRIATRTIRSTAHFYWGRIAALRGDHRGALEHQQAALATLDGRRRGNVTTRMIEYAEIFALVNGGQVAEARRLLATRHPEVPRGDYLRAAHWTADLYVAFAEGKNQLNEEDVHERARAALRMNASAGLLGLCAWADVELGATDQAWHLLGEAIERLPGQHVERTLPLLYAWMEAHRAEATPTSTS